MDCDGTARQVGGDFLAEASVEGVIFECYDGLVVTQIVECVGVEMRYDPWIDEGGVETAAAHNSGSLSPDCEKVAGSDNGNSPALFNCQIACVGIIFFNLSFGMDNFAGRGAHHNGCHPLGDCPVEHGEIFLDICGGEEKYARDVGYHRHVEKAEMGHVVHAPYASVESHYCGRVAVD